MIIIKTNLKEIPIDCKECPYHIQDRFGDIGCPLNKDFFSLEEYNEKKKMDNCPLEVVDEKS